MIGYSKGSDKMIEEIWKDAKYLTRDGEWLDFKGVYQVSNLGNVRSFRKHSGGAIMGRLSDKPKLLKTKQSKSGYLRVGLVLTDGEHNKLYLLHRLIASTFIEIPERLLNEKKIQVNHINEDKSDNRIENLEWCTPYENTNHGTRTKRAIANSVKTRLTKEWKEKNPSYNHPNACKVIGVHVETGEIVELNSMNCADEFFNIPLAGRSVSAAVRGRQKTAYGYKWYYRDDYLKLTQ